MITEKTNIKQLQPSPAAGDVVRLGAGAEAGRLRTSSYTIYVDLPGNEEEMLLVHTYTGAFDKVSRRVATFIRSLELGRPPKPLYGDWTPEPELEGPPTPPSDATLTLLKRRGYLTPWSREEEEKVFQMYVNKLHAHMMQRAPTYLFMPTYDCNLRCPYCFQDHMRTDASFGHLLRRMTTEMVDRIFASMPKVEELHSLPADGKFPTEIGLFGGEPLLAANRPIVEHILRRAEERGRPVKCWAISNGTELDAYQDLIGPGGIASLQITLDGPPAEHDKRRVYADGSGSWARIAKNITLALERGVSVVVRTNVDRNNIGQIPGLADEFIRYGWDKSPMFGAQVAPIRAENAKTDAKTTMNTWQLDQALAELKEKHPQAAVVGSVDDAIGNQARRVFSSRGFPALKPSFCAAHTGMYIFDSFGDIYACWEKTGDARVRIGHLKEDGDLEFNAQFNSMWRSRTVTSNPVCTRCRYNLYCGGGCAVLALGHSGGFYKNYCDGFAHRFRAAVAEAYVDHVNGKSLPTGPGALCDM